MQPLNAMGMAHVLLMVLVTVTKVFLESLVIVSVTSDYVVEKYIMGILTKTFGQPTKVHCDWKVH